MVKSKPGAATPPLASRNAPPSGAAAKEMEASEAVRQLIVLVRDATGHDFSLYKQSTILRRAERRMAVNRIERLEGYVLALRQDPAEVVTLFRDLLIGVTSFFRDKEAYEAIAAKVIPDIVARKAPGEAIRVWVPGCSTGEEAYSLAILFQEHLEAAQARCTLQVFATDINSQAIEHARAGVYPASIAADVSPERLARFFVPSPDGSSFRIHEAIRDMLVFSGQNLIEDPPFSRLDLVSCRNILIYMDAELQHRVISMFHCALNPHGVLFLGSSENIGETLHLFASLDKHWKIYRRRENVSAGPVLGTFFQAGAKCVPPLAKAPSGRGVDAGGVFRTPSPAWAAYGPGAGMVKKPRTKEELQKALKELETSNEELKTANEELLTANEELLSANDRLETSREEMQSANGELSTVNAELQIRLDELSLANGDMDNLLAGTGLGAVFVDHALRIQRFTPLAARAANLAPGDIGRPAGHIVSNLVGYDRLVEDLQAVLNTLVPAEVEVRSKEGRVYRMGLKPYRTAENVIKGAVIIFVDITGLGRPRDA